MYSFCGAREDVPEKPETTAGLPHTLHSGQPLNVERILL